MRLMKWLSRAFFAAACLVLVAAVASYSGFDGVVLRGMNAGIGDVPLGTRFVHHISVINLTFQPATALVEPMCGCALEGDETYTIAPWHYCDITIPYQVNTGVIGPTRRRLRLIYKHGLTVREAAGVLRFRLTRRVAANSLTRDLTPSAETNR